MQTCLVTCSLLQHLLKTFVMPRKYQHIEHKVLIRTGNQSLSVILFAASKATEFTSCDIIYLIILLVFTAVPWKCEPGLMFVFLQQQQRQALHHERQVNEPVDDNTRRAGDVNEVVLRHQSNGQVSQSNRLSDHRRSRLKAASATLDSEDLCNAGILELWRNDEQHGLPESSDRLMQTLPLNGENSTRVERETTC